MAHTLEVAPAPPGAPPPPAKRIGGFSQGDGSAASVLVKITILGVVLAIAIWGMVPLISGGYWIGLAILLVVTALLFYIYLSPRRIPAKYLIVGTLLLIGLQVVPVLFTIAISFTNFGDGHRGTQQDAITAIETASIKQVAGTPTYALSPATNSSGAVVFLLADPTGNAFVGTSSGLTPLPPSAVQLSASGTITHATGYTVLTPSQAAAQGNDIRKLRVPSARGTIYSYGLSTAFTGVQTRTYNSSCNCITDKTTGQTWTADGKTGFFVSSVGDELAQGWRVSVGFHNFTTIFSNSVIRSSFFKIVTWNFAFAFLVPAITFILGLGLALVMNNARMKGQRFYRSLLILPYAMPAFAMLLVWSSMFNTEFGVINRALGIHIDWFGTPWGARAAVLLIQLWMGYPYMFLICTGALQSIPADLTEAAQVDGAPPFKAFRTITFPLLLVATAPLLIASFAANFNNFGAIFFTTGGGPFPPDNPSAGATDLLISYTYRLAFGTGGVQYGFAAAISIMIFMIVAVVSYAGFRRTRALEEIN